MVIFDKLTVAVFVNVFKKDRKYRLKFVTLQKQKHLVDMNTMKRIILISILSLSIHLSEAQTVQPVNGQPDGKSLAIEGLKYYNGRVVAQNFQQAATYFRQSAERGDMVGEYFLGLCYFNGEGVAQNYSEAFKWYDKSAKQGCAQALCELGYCYYMGNGVEPDPQKAFELYEQSANKGYPKAQYYLGDCYFNGEGVDADESKAKYWYHKAADQGNEEAKEALVRLLEE